MACGVMSFSGKQETADPNEVYESRGVLVM